MIFGIKFIVTTRFIPILQEKTQNKEKINLYTLSYYVLSWIIF